MHYELWHIPPGNLVNTFDQEHDALGYVRQTYDQHGRARAEEFALGTEDRRGRSRQVAVRDELLARALDAAPKRAIGSR